LLSTKTNEGCGPLTRGRSTFTYISTGYLDTSRRTCVLVKSLF